MRKIYQRLDQELSEEKQNRAMRESPIRNAQAFLTWKIVYTAICRSRGKSPRSASNYAEGMSAESSVGHTDAENGSYLFVRMSTEMEGIQLPKEVLGFRVVKRYARPYL